MSQQSRPQSSAEERRQCVNGGWASGRATEQYIDKAQFDLLQRSTKLKHVTCVCTLMYSLQNCSNTGRPPFTLLKSWYSSVNSVTRFSSNSVPRPEREEGTNSVYTYFFYSEFNHLLIYIAWFLLAICHLNVGFVVNLTGNIYISTVALVIISGCKREEQHCIECTASLTNHIVINLTLVTVQETFL